MKEFNAAFWRWFGDSKIVDEDGNPLVVYHGTTHDFGAFKKPSRTDANSDHSLMFFTPNIEYAEIYAKNSKGYIEGNVMPVYLSVQRLFDTRIPKHMAMFKNKTMKSEGWPAHEIKNYIEDYFCDKLPHWSNGDVINFAVREGFDGVMFCERKGKYVSIGVFDPKQIKSAIANDGTWDIDDPDIRSNPDNNDDEDLEDWGSDEWMERFDKKIQASADKIFQDAGDSDIVRFVSKDNKLQLYLSQTSNSGKNNWQVTWVAMDDTPISDTIFKKREDALLSIAGAHPIVSNNIGSTGYWKVVETRNVRKGKR